jgi:hypothetical protein
MISRVQLQDLCIDLAPWFRIGNCGKMLDTELSPYKIYNTQLGCAGFAYIFFMLQSEKNPLFSLSFALSEYERRPLCITLTGAKDKKILLTSGMP